MKCLLGNEAAVRHMGVLRPFLVLGSSRSRTLITMCCIVS